MTAQWILLTALMHGQPSLPQVAMVQYSYEPMVYLIADAFLVPRDIAMSVGYNESTFRPWKITKSGKDHKGRSRGLYQIDKSNEKELVEKSGLNHKFRWNNAYDSAYVGIAYLSRLHKQFGNWILAVAAYNAGPGAITKALKTGKRWPKETQVYVKRIFGDDLALAFLRYYS